MHTTIRAELADHIQAAFTTGSATRSDLLAAAIATNARPQAIDAHGLSLRRPDTARATLRQQELRDLRRGQPRKGLDERVGQSP